MILRDEPDFQYWYKCIKEDEKNGVNKGRFVQRLKKDLDDDEHYKLVAICRQAFVGDMQEQLNKAAGTNLMEKFAKSASQGQNTRIVYLEKIIRQTFPEYLRERRINFFQKLMNFFNIKHRLENRKVIRKYTKMVKDDKEFFDTYFKDNNPYTNL